MIGTVLGNRYEIIEKIGGGGMALVYKAKCKLLNRNVAIKVLRDEFVNDEEFIKKFRRESQSAASLSHPNIVNIYDVGVEQKEDQEIHYIVMEYINGKTLKDIIVEKGKLSFDETVDYSIQIAEALEHAHKNHIIHRDIKPHNIMITEDGRAKVTDFGIARAATSSTMTNTSNVIGSVHYFSPEQARGGYTDERSDIYSLGIVMYEMITGKVPYEGDSPISVALKHIQEDIVSPKEIDSTVPIGLQNIIMKCVKKTQSDRYKTASELLQDLKRIKISKKEEIVDDTNDTESATQIIPIIGDEIDNITDNKKQIKKKKGKENGGLKYTLLAILLAFLVVSLIAFGFFRLKDFFITKEIPVPDLVGKTEEAAREEVEDLGLKFKVGREVYDSNFDKGIVTSQKPTAEDKVKKGYTIEVIISKGSNLIKVPNLINKSIEEIDDILAEFNLGEGMVDYKNSDSIEANKIINQSPEAYSEVEEGTRINIIVSKGPEKKTIKMPNLLGQKEKDAENALIAYGLVRSGNRVVEPSDKYPEGTVMWQSINANTEVNMNTKVDLSISSGPKKEPEEPAEPEEPEKSTKPEKPNDDKETSFTISITIAEDKEETEIRVDRIQDGNRKNIYGKVHQVEEKTAKIPLKGKLDAKFEVYVDGVLIDTINHPDR